MRLFHRIRRALIELFRRSRWEREADEELRTFLEMSVADRLSRGTVAGGARRAATLAAGGIEQRRSGCVMTGSVRASMSSGVTSGTARA